MILSVRIRDVFGRFPGNVRLYGIGSGSCHSTRTRTGRLGRGVPESDRRRMRRIIRFAE